MLKYDLHTIHVALVVGFQCSLSNLTRWQWQTFHFLYTVHMPASFHKSWPASPSFYCSGDIFIVANIARFVLRLCIEVTVLIGHGKTAVWKRCIADVFQWQCRHVTPTGLGYCKQMVADGSLVNRLCSITSTWWMNLWFFKYHVTGLHMFQTVKSGYYSRVACRSAWFCMALLTLAGLFMLHAIDCQSGKMVVYSKNALAPPPLVTRPA